MADRGVRRSRVLLSLCVTLLLAGGGAGCGKDGPRPGEVLDEASRAGRTAASFPAAAEDYFHDMDGGGALTREEIQGRNTWIVWTGGNDRFWDGITVSSFGLFDLLKIVSSHPDKSMEHLDRSKRWVYLGLVNEPCFDKPTGPDPAALRPVARQATRRLSARSLRERAAVSGCPDRGAGRERAGRLLLRVRVGDRRPPAVPESRLRRGGGQEVGPGDATTPTRSTTTRRTWCGRTASACPARSATSARAPPSRPPIPRIRSGRTSPPTSAPSTSGSTASSAGRTTGRTTCIQLLHTSRPGALDTSLVSTDYINNPRTMNAVYLLGPRLQVGKRWGKETLAGGGLNNSQFNDYVKDGPADRVLPEAEHRLDPACPEGRLGLGGRPGGPQSRLPEHRPLQRGVAAALQRPRRREADLARSRSASPGRTPSTGSPPRLRRRAWRSSSSRRPCPTA